MKHDGQTVHFACTGHVMNITVTGARTVHRGCITDSFLGKMMMTRLSIHSSFRTAIAAIAVSATLGFGATPALADTLVVRSTGPSAPAYPVGRRLADSDRIVLRTGDRVVVVGDAGTRTLSGPGNFPVRAGAIANGGSRATLRRYISAGNSTTISRTGAVRGDPGADAPRAPNLWVVDISRGGTFCVADAASLNLWRGNLDADTLLTVERLDTPGTTPAGLAPARLAPVRLAFVTGQALRLWPADVMPVTEGARYRLSGAGLSAPVEVGFALSGAPATDANAATVAEMLAMRGCNGQLADLGAALDDGA